MGEGGRVLLPDRPESLTILPPAVRRPEGRSGADGGSNTEARRRPGGRWRLRRWDRLVRRLPTLRTASVPTRKRILGGEVGQTTH